MPACVGAMAPTQAGRRRVPVLQHIGEQVGLAELVPPI